MFRTTRRLAGLGLLILYGVCATAACAGGHVPLAAGRAPSGAAESHLRFGGLDRTYVLHVPPRLDNPAPLVLVLHGGDGTAEATERFSGFSAVADAHGFLAVYPNGTDRNWADGRGADQPDRRGVDDVGFLSALVDAVAKQYPVDPARVYATGISNGGFMAQRLGCDLAGRIAAIAPVAGTLGTGVTCTPAQPVSVFEIHGTADPLVPYGGGVMRGRGGSSAIVSAPDAVAAWAQRDGCPDPPRTSSPAPVANDGTSLQLTLYDGCRAGTSVWLSTVVGGGHTWPDGLQYLPERLIGRVSHQFNASQAIWDFFATHPRSASQPL